MPTRKLFSFAAPSSAIITDPRGFRRSEGSVSVDALRAAAAVLVLFEHAVLLIYGFQKQPNMTGLVGVIYDFLMGGREAVLIFFVMSGLLVGGSVLRSFGSGTFSWSEYLSHRLVRLWIVLIPALVLGALWDGIGLHLSHPGIQNLYAGTTGTGMLQDVKQTYTVKNWLGCLFFQNGVLTKIFGSNGPLWSLADEFGYYIIFPCIVMCFSRSATVKSRVIHFFIALCCSRLIDWQGRRLFLVWLFGVALACLPRVFPRFARWFVWPLFVVLFYFATTHHGVIGDNIFGLGAAVFVWMLISNKRESNSNAVFHRISRYFAEMSYTLYAIHTPLLLLVVAILLKGTFWTLTPAHVLFTLGISLGLVLYAAVLAQFTERHTAEVRQSIMTWVQDKNLLQIRQTTKTR